MSIGEALKRREDPHLVTGRGVYTDDLAAGALHLAFVRSQHAHARIVSLNDRATRATPGVVRVLTGAEVADLPPPPLWMRPPNANIPPRTLLAVEKVRYVGEPVVAVLATDAYAARDAADLLEIEYEPLPAVSDPDRATEPDAPLVYDSLSSNVAFTLQIDNGDVESQLRQADEVVRLRVVHPRVAAVPLETRAVFARYDPFTGGLEVVISTQYAHSDRFGLATVLGVPEGKIRVITRDVGGAFGAKGSVYAEEAVACYLSWTGRCSVRWVETRSEHLRSTYQGRGHISDITLAVRRNGEIVGLDLRVVSDIGAFMSPIAGGPPNNVINMACGPYRVPAVRCQLTAVYTNRTPIGPYRGAGRPEATYTIERAIDAAARQIGVDPAEIRRRNFISADDFPYRTPTGATYDSGNYRVALDKVLELAEYSRWREEQGRLRSQGRYIGIGLCSFVEPSGAMLSEFGEVRVVQTGKVLVLTGSSPHGQGLYTAFAQVVAGELGVPIEDVEILHGDTAVVAMGTGTFGSRSGMLGGSSALLAARSVRAKMREIAANLLEAGVDDIEVREGRFSVAGVPDRAISFAEVAAAAYAGRGLSSGMELGLVASNYYRTPAQAYPFGSHVAVVEIDVETGAITVLRYVAVDDAGNLINPLLVDGQIHGGLAQGIGQALFEEIAYDEAGQLLTGSLMDYAVPKAGQLPDFVLDHTTTPSPHNPLGAKGVGEAGAVAAPPAIVNAVLDALAPLGVEHLDMPLTQPKIWAAIQAAMRRTDKQR